MSLNKVQTKFDVAIIGSGASGGRMAWDLTRLGLKCVLLEAGKHFSSREFPLSEFSGSAKLFWGGGLEIAQDGRLGFLRAKCVGGTTIVNQALLDRFDEGVWAEWRDRSGVDFFSDSQMQPHYEAVESDISIQTLGSEAQNKNAKIFQNCLKASGVGCESLRRAQTRCEEADCIACLYGCPRDSKQSSMVTSIARALKQGLELNSEFEAQSIKGLKGAFEISGLTPKGTAIIQAARVVLAAGALGNVRILDSLSSKSPALARTFACHPQFMTYAEFSEPIDAFQGAFQTLKSQDLGLKKRGFKLENVFAPPISTAMLVPGFGRKHLEQMKRYRYFASMEVCIRDEPVGQIQIKKDGTLVIKKTLTDQDRRRARDGLEQVRSLFEKAHPLRLIRAEQGFGLHLMASCPMGTSPDRAVVSPEFEVFGNPGIYCADSSIFPSAPGINPSLTIMALTHRAAGYVVRGLQ